MVRDLSCLYADSVSATVISVPRGGAREVLAPWGRGVGVGLYKKVRFLGTWGLYKSTLILGVGGKVYRCAKRGQ